MTKCIMLQVETTQKSPTSSLIISLEKLIYLITNHPHHSHFFLLFVVSDVIFSLPLPIYVKADKEKQKPSKTFPKS